MEHIPSLLVVTPCALHKDLRHGTCDRTSFALSQCWKRLHARSSSAGAISENSGYVDNRASTPYGPRNTVVHGGGERYAASTTHPSAPRIPTAEPVARLQCPEPRLGGRLSRSLTCPPLC